MTLRRLTRAVVAALLIAVAAAFATTTNAAAEESTAGVTADSWYRTLPTCATPAGCPAGVPVVSTFPEQTLHVEATAGQESARSYVAIDMSQVPPDATLSGGTLELPLSADDGAGTMAPESAALRACLATEPLVDDAAGSTDQPPAVDCNVASTATVAETVFTVDLGPFIAAWEAGKPQHGIALVPALDGAPMSSWHLAFDARDRSGPEVRPITATLSYSTSSSSAVSDFDPFPVLPPPAAEPSVGFLELSPAFVSPSAPAAPPVASAPTPAPAGVAPQPIAFPIPEFRYPSVMFVPLALLIGGLFLVRTFTQQATPPGRRAL